MPCDHPCARPWTSDSASLCGTPSNPRVAQLRCRAVAFGQLLPQWSLSLTRTFRTSREGEGCPAPVDEAPPSLKQVRVRPLPTPRLQRSHVPNSALETFPCAPIPYHPGNVLSAFSSIRIECQQPRNGSPALLSNAHSCLRLPSYVRSRGYRQKPLQSSHATSNP